MKIEILGAGCSKCQKLAAHAESAVKELNTPVEIVKVTDIDAIIAYGVMVTPALAVDGEVVSSGRVLSTDEIKRLLQNNRGRS